MGELTNQSLKLGVQYSNRDGVESFSGPRVPPGPADCRPKGGQQQAGRKEAAGSSGDDGTKVAEVCGQATAESLGKFR